MTTVTNQGGSMNLSDFDPNDDGQRRNWSQRFEELYQANRQRIIYDPSQISIIERHLPSCGAKVRVAICKNRPQCPDDEHSYGDILEFKNTLYRCTVRARPYTPGHMVVYCLALAQDECGLEQLDLLLQLGAAFGADYEIFYNGVAPTWSRFHFQIIERRTTVLENLRIWPASVEEFEDVGIKHAGKVLHLMEEHRAKGHACDLLVQFNADGWRVLLIPRRTGATRPPNKLGDPANFGTVGCLEMCGFWLANKTVEAFELIAANPGLYEEALQRLSIRGSQR